MRKKVLIIINSEEFVRNYMTTNAFSEIEKDFQCFYLLADRIKKSDVFRERAVLGEYLIDKAMAARH